jgi:hypothetical protein
LAAAVYVEGMSDYQRVAIAAVDAATDAMTALNAWIAAHLSWVQQRRALAGFLFGTLPDEVMVLASEPLSECNAAFYARMESLFRSAVDAGLMGEVDLSLAYALCIGPAQEYCRRWTRGAAATPPRALTGALQTAALAALATTCPRMRNIDKRAATQRGRARDRKARQQTP